MIELININFKDILHYPTIRIVEGETTFITGPSGSGKSTLLKLINGTVDPKDGIISLDGVKIEDYNRIELRRDYILCDQSVFLYDQSVRDNFHSFYNLREESLLTDSQIKNFLELSCSSAHLDDSVISMSGGERQRIYIALCLSLARKAIMFDEPTSALDDVTADTLLKNIKTYCIQNHLDLIIVSHNSALSEKYADNLVIISNLKEDNSHE
ncbi:ATP-binding cassette domain-containing protein [Erysipelothrix rhusiopathiae]|nr:ATP-binding cassette domain-containing protein [Erysipelothrix rhusiopathiae]